MRLVGLDEQGNSFNSGGGVLKLFTCVVSDSMLPRKTFVANQHSSKLGYLILAT